MSVALKYRKRVGRVRKVVTFKSLTEASRETGIPFMTLRQRIKVLGWSHGKSLTKPVRQYRQKEANAA